jgi:putative glutamine amidotransferase
MAEGRATISRGAGRPVIGVTASRRRGRLMWWFNRFAIWRAGGRAIRIVPGAEPRIGDVAALVVGGGDDVQPSLYGSDIVLTVRVDEQRDRMEQSAIHEALKRRIPLLGICRGAQMINIVHGGTLHADMYEVHEMAPRMHTVLPRKLVRLDKTSRLYGIVRCEECRVNALHHQSVARVGRGLRVVGRDEYGIVQALEGDADHFVVGVQWHPEFLVFDRGHQGLFRALIRAARGAAIDRGGA